MFFPGHVAIYAGSGMMIDEPHTYDRPSSPSGSWTQAYARTDPVGQHVSGYYRFAGPASAQAPSPSPRPSPSSSQAPPGWPTASAVSLTHQDP